MLRKKCISVLLAVALILSCLVNTQVFAEVQQSQVNEQIKPDLDVRKKADRPLNRENTKVLSGASQETNLSFSRTDKKAIFKVDSGGDLDQYLYRDRSPIDFTIDLKGFNVDPSKTTKVTMRVYDVDQLGSSTSLPEVDKVYVNGTYLGTLTGANDYWSTVSFTIPKGVLSSGNNDFKVEIDENDQGWAVQVDYAEIEIPFNIAQIESSVSDTVEIKRGKTDDVIKNPIWKTSFDASGNVKSKFERDDAIADKISGGFFNMGAREFTYSYKIGYWPKIDNWIFGSTPSWTPNIKYKWSITGSGENSGDFKELKGWENNFKVTIPDKIGKYKLEVVLQICNGNEVLTEEKRTHTLYVVLNDPQELGWFSSYDIVPPKTYWLDLAMEWGGKSNVEKDILDNLNKNIYTNPLKWKYGYRSTAPAKDNAIQLLENAVGTTYGDCYVFRDVWRIMAATLGIKTDYYDYEDEGFITSTTKALDNNDYANAFPKGSSTADRWSFGSHALGKYGGTYYDPTFGLSYTDPKKNIYAELTKPLSTGILDYEYKILSPGGGALNVYLSEIIDWSSGKPRLVGVKTGKGGWPVTEYIKVRGNSAGVNNLQSTGTGEIGIDISGYTENTVDKDSNGLYDYLTAELDVDAKEAGTYIIDSMLFSDKEDLIVKGKLDTSEETTALPNISIIELKEGKQKIKLYFSGEQIRKAGFDGPYTISVSFSSDGSIGLHKEYKTGKYAFSDFQGNLMEYTGVTDAGSDVNNDGQFDTLDVDVGLNVLADGDYIVEGSLFADGKHLCDAKVEKKVKKGSETVTLKFVGQALRFSGVDGPYDVYITLFDGKNSSTIDYRTKEYKYTDFQVSDAFFTGSIKDTAIDADTNGIYEGLGISAEAAAIVSGDYNVRAILQDKDGKFIESADKDVTLGGSPTIIDFNFQGENIYKSKSDGPYTVIMVIMDQNGKEITGIKCNTQNYRFSQFNAPKVSITGSFSDTAADVNNDEINDMITVNIGLKVAESGQYTIEGSLYDKNGQFITSSSKNLNLGQGETSVSLDFKGSDIYKNGVDGPYSLGMIKISQSDGEEVLSALNVYTTNEYKFADFQSSTLSLTGNNSDSGEDKDGDGLYDYLTVSLEVMIPANGSYSYNARLVDKNDEELQWASGTQYYTAGKQIIKLSFDGRFIYGNKVDGVFSVKDLSIYSGNNVFSTIDTYTTKEYKWEQFEHTCVVYGKASTGYMPIKNANIFINGVSSDFTNEDGDYRLMILNSGTYVINIDSDSIYKPWEIWVDGEKVTEGSNARLTVKDGQELKVDFITKAELPPVLTHTENKTVSENELLEFDVSVLEPNGQSVTYAVYNAPKGAVIDAKTGTFSWKPGYDQAGVYKDIEIAVTDGISTVQDMMDIEVVNVNRAPVLSPIGDITAKVNEPVKIKLSATDPDGDSVTYTVYNQPAGGVLDPVTNVFSWTPDFSKSGKYNGIKFEVSDGELSDSEVISITVPSNTSTSNNSGSSNTGSNNTHTATPTATPTVTPTATPGSNQTEEPKPSIPKALQHTAYIKGYNDGSFRPDNPITRAEASVLIANLLGGNLNEDQEATFIDVPKTHWAAKYIGFVVEKGLFNGYPDKTFKPDDYITRAEFAAVIYNLLAPKEIDVKGFDFKDMADHWAKKYIDYLSSNNYVKGFENGYFMPDDLVSRSQCVAIINRTENRGPLYGARKIFSDVSETHWAFKDIAEASITHIVTLNIRNQEVLNEKMQPSTESQKPKSSQDDKAAGQTPAKAVTPDGVVEIIGLESEKKLDLDKDGKEDYLQVDIKVNAKEDGKYMVSSNLLTGDEELIAQGRITTSVDNALPVHINQVQLTKGINLISMYFPGSAIHRVKNNGLYKVKFSLYSSGTVPANTEFTTAKYNYMDFKE